MLSMTWMVPVWMWYFCAMDNLPNLCVGLDLWYQAQLELKLMGFLLFFYSQMVGRPVFLGGTEPEEEVLFMDCALGMTFCSELLLDPSSSYHCLP